MKKILPVIGFSLLFLCSSIIAFVTLTTPGLTLLITLAKSVSPGEVSVATIKGSLIKGVVLDKVRYNDGYYEVSIADASITFRLAALIRKQVVITSLHLSNVTLKELQSAPTSSKSKLPEVTLPISLYLEEAVVESVDINQLTSQNTVHIEKLSLELFSMVGNHLQVKSFNLLQEQIAVELKGELHTTGDYPLHISSAYHLTFDHYSPISGKAVIEGHLLDCRIQSNVTKPIQATLSSRFTLKEKFPLWDIEATSNAIDLAAINRAWPKIVFGDLQLKGSGTFDKATLTIQTTSNLVDYPSLENIATKATLELHEERLRITELDMKRGTSHIHANGHMDWQKGVSWSIETQAKGFDPSIWFADWQGTLHGNGSMQGHLTSNGVYADFSLTELEGQLRGYPLNGQGKATLHGNMLNIESLRVSSGASRLTAHGEWGKNVNLHFSLQSPDIDQLWPDTTGTITSTGTVQGTREDPDITGHLSGNMIGYKTNSIGQLEASVKGKLHTKGGLDLRLNAMNVDVFEQHADDLQITMNGNPENVEFQARLKDTEQVLTIKLRGEQQNKEWQGSLKNLTIDNKKIGLWEVKRPSSFTVTSKKIMLDETCLTSAFSEEICTSGAYAFSSNWTVSGNIRRLSSQTLQMLLNQKDLLQGYVQGSWHLTGHNQNLDKGQLTIAMVDTAMVTPVAAKITSLQNIQGKLSVIYVNDELTAASRISLGDGSYLDTDVVITVPKEAQSMEALDLSMLPLNGQMTVQIRDIAAMNVFLEEHAQVTGMLQGTLNINGNIKHPLLKGDIQLTQGTANLFALGVTLAPLSLKAQITNNLLSLSANAQSGTGELSATGEVYLDKGFNQDLHFSINGAHFEVAKNDEMQIFISPDLVVTRSNGLTSVTGTIIFPEAHISYQGHEGTVSPSRDVVIVDANENITKSDTPLPLKTSITLIAGDAVDIDAYGLKGLLKGQLHITDISGELPLASGTLLVNNGSFTLYGKRLDIDVGRLLFSGGPLDNPGLEVRTEKRDNGTTVGMEVGGFLQQPEMRFYSSAAMEQYEILTRLLASSSSLGEVQDQTSIIGNLATKVGLPQLGEALQSSKNLLSIDDIRLDTGDFFDDISLIIGTWITPRFYVSYGHSLLKDSASFNTRYTLGKGFFFQTETGTTQNGGDLIYEIKK